MTSPLFSKPDRNRAFGGLLGATVNLGLGDRAERMIDHRRHQVRQAERFALHLGLVQEFGGDHDRGRPPPLFEFGSVMRTARRA